jgi:hypothetical protein
MVWKQLSCLLAGLSLSACIRAQHYFYDDGYYDSPWLIEAGLKAGLMNSLTDLGGHSGIGSKGPKDVNWNCSRPCTGAYFSVEWANFLSARVNLSIGSVHNADSLLHNDNSVAAYRFQRNLSFESPISELSIIMQIRPFELLPSIQGMSTVWSPYLFIGAGRMRFEPFTFEAGKKVHLRPLHLEGQGFPEYPERKNYEGTAWCFPVGAGLQFEPSARFRLHVDVSYRILSTDYLDDVSTTYINPELYAKYLSAGDALVASRLADRRKILPNGRTNISGVQRGNAGHNDAYFTIGLGVGWVFGREKR